MTTLFPQDINLHADVSAAGIIVISVTLYDTYQGSGNELV